MRQKYSRLLLDEAVQCYRTMKLGAVVKLTGVGAGVIKKAWLKYRIKHGIPPVRKPGYIKYTPEQKMACIKLAIRYADTGHVPNIDIAFEMAGKVLKINGRSIHRQWRDGTSLGSGELPIQTFQQPGAGTSAALSGSSIQTASPQSQRCREQQLEVAAMRPAPSMIKRRKFTSATIPRGILKGHKEHT